MEMRCCREKKIEEFNEEEAQEKRRAERDKARGSSSRRRVKKEETAFEAISKNTMVRQIGRTVARELTRGLLGVLGIKKTTRRRRR